MPVREPAVDLAKRFAQRPLDLVALHRAAEPATNGHSEPYALVAGVGAWKRVQDEEPVRVRGALAVGTLEVAAAGQPAASSPFPLARAHPGARASAACGPCAAGAAGHPVRRASACERETHGLGRACASSADRSASSGSGSPLRVAIGDSGSAGRRQYTHPPPLLPAAIGTRAGRLSPRNAASPPGTLFFGPRPGAIVARSPGPARRHWG